jgi:hypothetical protein
VVAEEDVVVEAAAAGSSVWSRDRIKGAQ